MKKYNFDVYEKENGETPFLVYLDSLDVKSRAKVLRAITIVEDFGAHTFLLAHLNVLVPSLKICL